MTIADGKINDIERALPLSNSTEHVILSVQGMTCTGCEKKLSRALGDLPSVTNLKTSLVLSRAEFDLNLSLDSVSGVIQRIARATDFQCERIFNSGQELDVKFDGEGSLFNNPPVGVTDVIFLDKHTARIRYDPQVIGARDLLQHSFGFPLTLAPLRPPPSVDAGNKHLRKVGLQTLVSVVLTIPVLVLSWASLPPHPVLYGSVSLALATAIQVFVAGPFYPAAIKSLLLSRVIEMDLLIVLSTTAAYVFSVVAFGYTVTGHPLSTGEFFETSTLLVSLIMLGRFVSALARQKAVESISVHSLQPSTALRVLPDGKGEEEIDTRLFQYGDIFRVMPYSRIATDGTVVSGASEVDESLMTGESLPVAKTVGSAVIAGSVNGASVLDVRVTRLPGENTVSTIAMMIDEAKASKPKIQATADRVAGYFVPFVVVLTTIIFVVRMAVSIFVNDRTPSAAAVEAITFAIAVLIVSCPCAIGLAVPMVIVIASGVAAERGIVFKDAETVELARKASHVVFDKTGTLTWNELTVSVEQYLNQQKEFTQSILLGLVNNITHPVSSAVAKHLKHQDVLPTQLDDVKVVIGSGVEGNAEGVHIRAGNARWLGLESSPAVRTVLSQGLTVFSVVINGELCAVFGLEATLRPDAATVVSSLQRCNISVSIVSGDDDGAVKAVGARLGIPASHIRSGCSPADKRKYLEEIMTDENNKGRVVIFCGDGTNDAVALAQATIGIHINEGTDIAQSAADAVLMRPALSGILALIDLSRAAFIRIAFNFAWAFVYNVFAILLAAGAFVHARIPPQYAGLGELVSVVPVIVIALQLRWAKV